MRRTYTCREMFRRHPALYLGMIIVLGSGADWQACLGRTRRRLTPSFTNGPQAVAYLSKRH